MSESVAAVFAAINAIQADLAKEGISKERTNREQGYQFRGIDDVYNALSPLLSKHKLCILPRVLNRTCEQRPTRNGGISYSVVIEMDFDFICSVDGSRHIMTTYGEAMDTGDKATNKAISQAYKNCALMAFAIPTEGDNDPDLHTHEVVQPQAQQQRPPAQQTRQASATRQQQKAGTPPDNPSSPPAGAKTSNADAAIKVLVGEIARLAESMGYTNSDMADLVKEVYNTASTKLLPHATVISFKQDMAQKAALYVQIRDEVRRLQFDREAFDPDSKTDQAALQDRTQDTLANKASLDYASKPLRAKAAVWREWLDELKKKAP